MRQADADMLAARSREELLRRNDVFEPSSRPRPPDLPRPVTRCLVVSWQVGRLLAFGNGPATTDAQHVSVEFVHPVIVGKRALPALDLGPDFETRLPVVLRPEDMVMGFAFPERDARGGACAPGGRGAGRAHLRAGTGDVGDYRVRASETKTRSCARRSSRSSTTCCGRRCTCTSSTGSRGTTWEPLPFSTPSWARASSGSKASSKRCRARCCRRWRRSTACGPRSRRLRPRPSPVSPRPSRSAWPRGARSSPSATAARPRMPTTW